MHGLFEWSEGRVMGLRGFVEGLWRSRVDNGTMRGSGWGEDYVRGVKRDVGGWINCDGGWRGNSGLGGRTQGMAVWVR